MGDVATSFPVLKRQNVTETLLVRVFHIAAMGFNRCQLLDPNSFSKLTLSPFSLKGFLQDSEGHVIVCMALCSKMKINRLLSLQSYVPQMFRHSLSEFPLCFSYIYCCLASCAENGVYYVSDPAGNVLSWLELLAIGSVFDHIS